MVFSGGAFKCILWHATATICVELINELLEECFPFANSLSRKKPHQAIQSSINLAARRIKAQEISIKGYVLFSCALGRINAIQAGKPPEKGVMDAAKMSLDFCYKSLKARSRGGTQQQDIRLQNDMDQLAFWEVLVG
jgi:hypothetical protein